MKKVLLLFGVLVVLVLVAVGGGLFWLTQYVNSPDFIRDVEEQASAGIGAPVTIGSIGISTEGLEARDVQIPNAAPYEDDSFLQLDRAYLSIRWMSLFEENLEVNQIQLNRPNLVVYQGEDGALLLPFEKEKPTAGTGGAATAPEARSGSGLAIALLDLTEGYFCFKDSEGATLVEMERMKVQTDYEVTPGGIARGQGTLSVPVLTLAGGIRITDLESPLEISGPVIDLPRVRGRAYGGDVSGTMQVRLAENENDPGAYSIQIELLDALLGELTRENEKPMEGVVDLRAEAKGTLEEPKEAQGKGTLQVQELSVPGVESFQALGSVLGLDVLQKGRADSLDAAFLIRDQLLEFTSFEIDSKGVDISLAGTLTFEKALNLDGEAVVEASASSLFNDLAGDLLDNERQKVRRIPLKIRGTVGDPQVDADTSAIAGDVGRTLLNRFLGPSSKESDSPDESSSSGDKKETRSPSLLDSLF